MLIATHHPIITHLHRPYITTNQRPHRCVLNALRSSSRRWTPQRRRRSSRPPRSSSECLTKHNAVKIDLTSRASKPAYQHQRVLTRGRTTRSVINRAILPAYFHKLAPAQRSVAQSTHADPITSKRLSLHIRVFMTLCSISATLCRNVDEYQAAAPARVSHVK
jgi:hypothetical protein